MLKAKYQLPTTDSSPRPCQHQRDIVRLFAACDPVGDGAGHDVADTGQGLIAIPLDEFDQSLLAELAEFVLRLSDAIAISDEEVARLHAHGALLISHSVEQADYRARSLHPGDPAVAAQQQWGKMSGVGVGQRARFAIVATQEHSRVLLNGSTAIELVVQSGH